MGIGRSVPARDEILGYVRDRRNWGRWGPDDQVGAVNLITPAKRVAAAKLVRTGRAVSLSRPFPKTPGPTNPEPGQHFMRWRELGSGGLAVDYFGISYHTSATTHIDALCHCWDEGLAWGGRRPEEYLTTEGALWGDIDQWRDGIVTRGVLLDVPRFRGEPFVTPERLLHGYFPPRPGLHVSCLPFIRETDAAVLVWDMTDAMPNDYGIPWTNHMAIFAFGVALVDNALLEPLAQACAEEGRYEFMLTIAPERVVGGTGSPVNSIALF